MTRQAYRFFGNFFAHATNFKNDTSWLDYCYIMIDSTFTTTHACFGRFSCDRLVRENTDPHFTTALPKAGKGHTCCFDLTSLQPTKLQSLQPKLTQSEGPATPPPAFPPAALVRSDPHS